jgi:hypothetical protein
VAISLRPTLPPCVLNDDLLTASERRCESIKSARLAAHLGVQRCRDVRPNAQADQALVPFSLYI